jgi:hypothetical protein
MQVAFEEVHQMGANMNSFIGNEVTGMVKLFNQWKKN